MPPDELDALKDGEIIRPLGVTFRIDRSMPSANSDAVIVRPSSASSRCSKTEGIGAVEGSCAMIRDLRSAAAQCAACSTESGA